MAGIEEVEGADLAAADLRHCFVPAPRSGPRLRRWRGAARRRRSDLLGRSAGGEGEKGRGWGTSAPCLLLALLLVAVAEASPIRVPWRPSSPSSAGPGIGERGEGRRERGEGDREGDG